MKNLLSVFLVLLSSFAMAQTSVPRFQKNEIPGCGCSAYMPGAAVFEKNFSEDSSEVFTGEITHGEHNFAVIAVKFSQPMGNNKEDNESLLESYLNHLKNQFGVSASAGYGKGHTMDSNENAIGMIDYWQDAEGLQYAVKGWIDSGHLAVLILYGKEEYPIYNVQDMFLNGFRFE